MKPATPEQLELEQNLMPSEATFLNVFAAATRRANQHFWSDPETGAPLVNRNKGEMYTLMISELCEAFEAVRKSKVTPLPDSHLPEFPAEVVELADAYIRMMDYVGEFYPDTFGLAVEAKRAYNRTRKDHTREARLAPGGKAF